MLIPKNQLEKIAHECNSLHIRARLIKAGVEKEIADFFTKEYEKRIHPLLYNKFNKKNNKKKEE